MSQIDSAQQTLQSLLQPGEQLIWWERPKLLKIRSPFTKMDMISLLIGGFIFALFIYFLNAPYAKKINSFIDNMGVFLISFVILSLLLHLTRFLKNLNKAFFRVPYRRQTLYVITNLRALIIVHLAGTEPHFLEYPPDAIDPPTSIVRPDGSGTLTFGEPRQIKVNRYVSPLTLPSIFWGISNVREVTALLERLRSTNELLPQDAVEHPGV